MFNSPKKFLVVWAISSCKIICLFTEYTKYLSKITDDSSKKIRKNYKGFVLNRLMRIGELSNLIQNHIRYITAFMMELLMRTKKVDSGCVQLQKKPMVCKPVARTVETQVEVEKSQLLVVVNRSMNVQCARKNFEKKLLAHYKSHVVFLKNGQPAPPILNAFTNSTSLKKQHTKFFFDNNFNMDNLPPFEITNAVPKKNFFEPRKKCREKWGKNKIPRILGLGHK